MGGWESLLRQRRCLYGGREPRGSRTRAGHRRKRRGSRTSFIGWRRRRPIAMFTGFLHGRRPIGIIVGFLHTRLSIGAALCRQRITGTVLSNVLNRAQRRRLVVPLGFKSQHGKLEISFIFLLFSSHTGGDERNRRFWPDEWPYCIRRSC